MKRTLTILALVAAAAVVGCNSTARLRKNLPNALATPGDSGLFVATPLTTDTAHETRFDVSKQGRLVFASDRTGNMELWARSADPNAVEQPKRLTRHSAIDDAPAFSPNGKRIAFVTHRDDARGDIAIIPASGGKPTILTNRDSADGEPCWAPGGKRIAFTRRNIASGDEQIYTVDVKTLAQAPLTEEGGRSPSYSPNGRFLAYTCFKGDRTGNIWVMDMANLEPTQLTQGPAIDGFPCWSDDGSWVYFTRFSEDTNGDGKVSVEDNGSIWRVSFDDKRREVQLTSGRFFDLFPRVRAGLLYYTTNEHGNSDVVVINAEGRVPAAPDIEAARTIAQKQIDAIPRSPYDAVVALRRVIADHGDSEERKDILAWARLEIAKQYDELKRLDQAKAELRRLIEDYPTALEQVGLAKVRLAWYQAQGDQTLADAVREACLDKSAHALLDVAKDARMAASVRAVAWLRAGDTYDLLDDTDKAVDAYQRVIESFPEARATCAEAALHKARIYRRLQAKVGATEDPRQQQQTLKTYLDILRHYADVRPVCQDAAREAIDLILEGQVGVQDQLRRVVKQYADMPVLPAMAQNRIADVYYRNNEFARAKDEYRKVITGKAFANEPEQIAAAQFALAQILYEETQYKKCLDIYAQLTDEQRRNTPEVFKLARRKYIRSTLDKADREFRLKDVRLALKTYRGLMTYDWHIVQAHRGYIECHDVLDAVARRRGQAPTLVKKVRDFYKDRAEKSLAAGKPDAVALYGWGLAATYLRPFRFDVAEAKIQLATVVEPRVPYFHQTLGWIYEQRYRRDPRTLWLQKCISRYQIAVALLDKEQDPRGYADLMGNLGNAYLKLGNVVKAHEYYAAREATGEPFRRMETQARFYENYAETASQLPQPDYAKSTSLYGKALRAVDSVPGDRTLWRAQIWAKRGLSYQEGRQYAEAVKAFRHARVLYSQLAKKAQTPAEKTRYLESARLHTRNVAYNTFKLAQSTQDRSQAISLLAQAREEYKGALAGLEGGQKGDLK